MSASIALYGSHARADQDELSDLDILVVADTDHEGHVARTVLPQCSSVAIYTWKRLRKMVVDQALFVQHLKLESIILTDPHERLRTILENFEPASEYHDDIWRTSLFFSLVEKIPCDKVGMGWGLDVLAVVARNIAISRIANSGRFVFSWKEVQANLFSLGILSMEEAVAFGQLRMHKIFYRGSGYSNVSKNEFRNICGVVGKMCGADLAPQFVNREKLTELDVDIGWNPYARCRLIERDLPGLRPRTDEDEEEFTHIVHRLRKGILEPRAYVWGYTSLNLPCIREDLAALEKTSALRELSQRQN